MNMDLSTGTMVVSLVALLGWLILNVQAFKSQQLGWVRTAQYGLAWVAIFGVVAFMATRFAA